MQSMIYRASALVFSLFILASQTGCDSNSNDDSSSSSSIGPRTIPDFVAPTQQDFGAVQVQFPPNFSHLSSDSTSLRGQVLDTENLSELTINGSAVSVDDQGNWQTEVSLAAGANEIEVTASFADSNATAQHVLYRDQFLSEAADVKWLASEQQFYALDSDFNALYILDSQKHTAQVFSPPVSAAENLINRPIAMEFDPDRNRIIVAQFDDSPFIAIDMTSGEQTALTLGDIEGVQLLETPASITRVGTDLYVADIEQVFFDADGNRIATPEEDASPTYLPLLYKMDLETGARTLLVQNPEIGSNNIGTIVAMAFDSNSDKIYFADFINVGASTIGSYSITDNEVTKLITRTYDSKDKASNYLFGEVDDLLVSDDGSTLFVLGGNTLVSVSTDERNAVVAISSNSTPKNQPLPMVDARNLVFNDDSESILYLDNSLDALINVSKSTGARSMFASNDVPFAAPADMAFAQDYSKLFISDFSLGRLFQLDLTTGEKSTVIARYENAYLDADLTKTNDDNPITVPQQIATTSDGQIIVFNSGFVSSIKPTGDEVEANILTRYAIAISDATYDPRNHTVYFAGSVTTGFIGTLPLGGENTAIINLSSNSSDNSDFPIGQILGLGIDPTLDILLASDNRQNRILGINLETGERTYFSDFVSAPSEEDVQLSIPKSIAVDSDNTRAFVLDSSQNAIIELDLTDGSRSVWLDIAAQPELGLNNIAFITIHPLYGYILAYDEQSHYVLAIDIESKAVARLVR